MRSFTFSSGWNLVEDAAGRAPRLSIFGLDVQGRSRIQFLIGPDQVPVGRLLEYAALREDFRCNVGADDQRPRVLVLIMVELVAMLGMTCSAEAGIALARISTTLAHALASPVCCHVWRELERCSPPR